MHLLHLRARWYAPETGTFLSRDPWAGNNIRPQTLNGWSYVEGNPVNYVDPSGRWSEEMLDNLLGDNWQTIYFGDDCSRGIFAGRSNLYEFLTSENTYDPVTLNLISVYFQQAKIMSAVGLRLDSNSPVDAMGYSGRGSLGSVIYGGGALEGILNLTAGEFSIFGAVGGGVLFPGKEGVVGGPYLVRNLPSNENYRNYFGSVGIAGGTGAGADVEAFWGAPKTSPIEDGTWGGFIGGGQVAGFAVHGGYAFFIEIIRIDKTGYNYFIPFTPDWNHHPEDIFPIIEQDIETLNYFAKLLLGSTQ